MRTTNVSLDRPTYYKNYYQKNKYYLRHRQRLRYYRNTPRFFELLKEYNKILIERKELNRRDNNYQVSNKLDTDTNFVLCFD
tara:strand:- start:114 stop:359 length:246 start_codon:yes stop_codon:yes gene_type:complete